MTDNATITVDQLTRRYGPPGRRGFDAVRGVTFAVRRGELFALLGTNGAGKTSTLELLEGLAAPTAGTVRVLGHDPYRTRRLVRPRIGIMLQEGGFPADLTVGETTRMWAGTLSTPRPADEVLGLVDLLSRSRVAVKQLSGGERRRLDLAIAILGRPEVLFLDEPTAGLDPESRRRAWQLIRGLLDAGTTVLLTTHYLEEVEALADRLAIMHHGRLVRMGTPAEVAAAEPSTISFTLPAGCSEPVPTVAGAVAVERSGTASHPRIALQTADLQRSLADLSEWASSHRLVLGQLTASPASLESVFLAVAASDRDDRLSTAGSPGAADSRGLGQGAGDRLSTGGSPGAADSRGHDDQAGRGELGAAA